MKTTRIANGQGFWGDSLDAPIEQARRGPIDYLTLDYLAEVTMSIMQMQRANVYFGGRPVAECLDQGGQVVICGRVTDTGLSLGPMIHEFQWPADAWNLLAAGTIAGHTVECGAQCTGGNCLIDWQTIPDLADIGYPIIEAQADGAFVITKHQGTGGRVTVASIKEQLLYEMGDPHAYITPDCVADFTTIQLEQAGADRVRFSGIKGRPATDTYKVSISYSAGWKAIGMLAYSWPDAYPKAKAAVEILRKRLERMGLNFDSVLTEFVGVDAGHGALAGRPSAGIAAETFRIGVRAPDKRAVWPF